MPCEMCGKDASTRPTLVEGTEMQLCRDCQKYGHGITKAPEATGRSKRVEAMQQRARRSRPRDVYSDNPEVLVQDYGVRVKKARTQKELTLEELADEINEKKSVVSKVEVGDHHPSDQLVKKLERFLGIKLMEQPESEVQVGGTSQGPKASGPVTLGDLLKDAMDKDKGA